MPENTMDLEVVDVAALKAWKPGMQVPTVWYRVEDEKVFCGGKFLRAFSDVIEAKDFVIDAQRKGRKAWMRLWE